MSSQKNKNKKPYPSIEAIIRATAKYNREHKTHLSYGQFVQQMEAGKIW